MDLECATRFALAFSVDGLFGRMVLSSLDPMVMMFVAHTKGLWDVLNNLSPTEEFLVDSIYSGWRAETPNGLNNPDQYMKSCARARHENVNAKFKRFGCLKVALRHGDQHGECFPAVATICQIEIEGDSPLDSVDYDDLRYSQY